MKEREEKEVESRLSNRYTAVASEGSVSVHATLRCVSSQADEASRLEITSESIFMATFPTPLKHEAASVARHSLLTRLLMQHST